eukprot:CAMPEP_0174367310 /NCGR_PEP_ID=MMETSP0811_2-20130205/84763_1 /TAXON_ID=73025 ORGANISM="Eutreptiella gymnastica-like, Strain CCMP1594" /NCGR_SAMPLE_ID=MMETSP0811_2 /ASSEMBLY_ACC=CAM_ASM_000667 /LENGTH=205 /DNA_ID=CAMNT_0015509753 /DNA_START=74 /DNA_END=688 /DNA_ORIENTATION=-
MTHLRLAPCGCSVLRIHSAGETETYAQRILLRSEVESLDISNQVLMAAQCPTRTVERCYTALCTPPSAVLGPTTCISPNGPAHHVCINLDLTLHGPAPSRRGTLAAALSNGAEGESDGYAEPEATQMQRCVKADECGRGLGLQTEIKITTRAFGWRVQYIVEASVVNRLRMQTHADMTVPNIIVHPHSRRARGQGNHNVPLKGSG